MSGDLVGKHRARSTVSLVGPRRLGIHFDFLDTYIPTIQETRITR